MTPEQERWAEALAVHRMHGERAAEHVAERIGTLAVGGDQDGIDRWMEIARAGSVTRRRAAIAGKILALGAASGYRATQLTK